MSSTLTAFIKTERVYGKSSIHDVYLRRYRAVPVWLGSLGICVVVF